jgi:hypothetical protein
MIPQIEFWGKCLKPAKNEEVVDLKEKKGMVRKS